MLPLIHHCFVCPLDFDVIIKDESKVCSLVNSRVSGVTRYVQELGLDPADVVHTFRAIVASPLSPRGAVLESNLLHALDGGHSVTFDALTRMSRANLIEIRDGNPSVLDYIELAPYARESYVCATSALARTSMAKVVKLLDSEEQAAKSQSGRARDLRRTPQL